MDRFQCASLNFLHLQAPEKNDIEIEDIAGSYAQARPLQELMFARIVLIVFPLVSDVIPIEFTVPRLRVIDVCS